ncbi:MAG: Gx transporter family protein [Clostridia bacterium]|nr:Gx transporter family protein [Clostridia bacterium]
MKNTTQRLAFLGVFSAFAIILSFVESLLPPIWSAVPGIKMGLPNIIIIFLLYRFSIKEAATVSFIRLLTVVLLFGNAMTFLYSLSGAVLSLTVMWLLKKTNHFSVVGVSISGGVCHNLGQIIAAVFLLGTKEIGFYMPVLTVSGTVAGIFVGFCGIILLKYTAEFKF